MMRLAAPFLSVLQNRLKYKKSPRGGGSRGSQVPRSEFRASTDPLPQSLGCRGTRQLWVWPAKRRGVWTGLSPIRLGVLREGGDRFGLGGTRGCGYLSGAGPWVAGVGAGAGGPGAPGGSHRADIPSPPGARGASYGAQATHAQTGDTPEAVPSLSAKLVRPHL